MTGLPITEVVHSQTAVSRSLTSIPMSSLDDISSRAGLSSELPVAAVNLSTNYQSAISGRISPEITSTKTDSGMDFVSVSPVAGEILSNFSPCNPNSQKSAATVVNPLLMTIPTMICLKKKLNILEVDRHSKLFSYTLDSV